jgi:hypothetical protein
MKRLGGIALLGCGLLLGCSDAGQEADQTPGEQLSVAADTSVGFQDSAVASPVTPVQGGEGAPLTATGELRGAGTDAPPGSVTVTEAGAGGTQVLLKIDHYTPGTRLAATVNQGSCEQPGTVVAPIGEPFEVGANGFATHQASATRSTASLLDGRHSVHVTTVGGEPASVLACAELPEVRR